MHKSRLDQALVQQGFVMTRSQAENYIQLGQVTVNKKVVTKAGTPVGENDVLALKVSEQYVSRAGLKLASVVPALKLNFDDKIVLDVGSSTGGFTDYALQHGARKVVAVDVGTNQLHPSLRLHPKLELHEKTDIRQLHTEEHFDIILIDVSFVALRHILPHVTRLTTSRTDIVAMVKPQFEATADLKHKGLIKNEHVRRDILKKFETWAKAHFVIVDKADAAISGTKGNRERFYRLHFVA